MNNQSNSPRQIDQYLKLWIYLLPVVGVIPAMWTLSRTKSIKSNTNNSDNSENLQYQDNTLLRQQQKVSRLAVNLILIWLSSYALFSLGAANVSGMMSLRLLYSNAIMTTGYFVTCTWLMSQLGKKKLFSTDDLN